MRKSFLKKIALSAVLVMGAVPAVSSLGQSKEETVSTTPPQVIAMYPCRIFRNTTDVSKISIEFSKPVVGVQAKDLTVNGSPATQVMGSGNGLYAFTGFPIPPSGKVEIVLHSGQIQTEQTAIPYEGEGHSWVCQLFDPLADDDHDGVTNDQEINTLLIDPKQTDTDRDGLPDPFEISHPCLDPGDDQAHPLGYQLEPLPGDDDADDDGRTDLEEFKAGTNPCAMK